MKKLVKLLQAQFDKMCATKKLFISSVKTEDLWKVYLNSFPKEYNNVFCSPDSSVHDCNNCKNFIRRYGNIVAIGEDYNIMTIFDVVYNEEYNDSLKAMSELMKNASIQDVFVETHGMLNKLPYEKIKANPRQYRLGVAVNHRTYSKEEITKQSNVVPDEIYKFHHFSLLIPSEFISRGRKSAEAIRGEFRDAKNVLSRTFKEISKEDFETALELAEQGSFKDALPQVSNLRKMIKYTDAYNEAKNSGLNARQLDNFVWIVSYKNKSAKFKNTLMGAACSEIAKGDDLEAVCNKWNVRVDPHNFMKSVKPITEKRKQEALKYFEEEGLMPSLERRFATLSDIDINKIKHVNFEEKAAKKFFDAVVTEPKKLSKGALSKATKVSISSFMEEILPFSNSVEAYFENKHIENLISLTTCVNDDAKPMFKWDNHFSWTTKSGLARKSSIKENVKKVGGNVKALVRVSLQWNDKDTRGVVDLDLHCRSKHSHIFFENKGRKQYCGGYLDVDMINPNTIGIENLFWKDKIKDGVYLIFVRNYNKRKNNGCKLEIEIEGKLYNYFYGREISHHVDLRVATITVEKGVISIEHHLPLIGQPVEKVYNINTKSFHKVNLVCLSPNYWGENNVGHKHYFFMLENCKTDKKVKSFHNENLNAEISKHRKVLDVLTDMNKLEPAENQLAGLGFNESVRDELIVRVDKRLYKIIF